MINRNMRRNIRSGPFPFLCLLCLLSLKTPGVAASLTDQIVIVANRNLPASVELANYYAAKRGIATNRICLLDLPANETMARAFYEDRLRDPFLDFLRRGKFITQLKREKSAVKPHDSGWRTVGSSVKFVALMYGVPLKIAETRGMFGRKVAQLLDAQMLRNDAAVDNELAAALLDSSEIAGRAPNFLYDQVRWDDLGTATNTLMLVTRLDGPDEKTVRRMIDDSIFAEQHGLWGRAYFDARGLKTGGYFIGDYWLREASARFERDGWWTVTDNTEPVWSESYPMENCAVYMGWYHEKCVGPFTRTNFAFVRGAFAYHNHSSNAKTLRTGTDFWCGPLLAKGACCTMGAVAEPYLQLTPNMQIFADRFLSGLTFAESAYMSVQALSWQTTVIGDPLYRPFSRPTEELAAALEKSDDPDAAWACLMQANQLILQGRFNIALEQIRGQLLKKDSVVLRERLADLYLANDQLAEADREYRAVIDAAKTPETAFRVAQKEVEMFRALKRYDDAAKIINQVREKWPGTVYDALLESKS